MILNSLNKYRDMGLLLMRLGLGLDFIFIHGLPKFLGGPPLWSNLGKAMSNLGINFFPEFWGFMAMFSEFICPIFLIIGFFFRPAAFLMAFGMFVAMMSHLVRLDPWSRVSHSMELLFVFLGLFLIGAGKYSIDEYLRRKKEVKNLIK